MDRSDVFSFRTNWNNYIKQYNLPVIKRTTIFKEHLYGCFCDREYVIENFIELTEAI